MHRHHKPRAFWRLARIWFRHVRMVVWLGILLVLVILTYLHNIGLPGFAQRAVVRAFAAKGVDLQFSRVHLAWLKSVQADHVRVQSAGSGRVPRIECRKLDLHFNLGALLRLKMVPEDLSIDRGLLVLPYPLTNGLTGYLTATNLNALIRFNPDGQWILETLTAELEGCQLSVSGTIANPGLIQDWRILSTRAALSRGDAQKVWKAVSQFREQLHFEAPPSLRLGFNVDGAKPEQLALGMRLKANAASAPWGTLSAPEISATLQPTPDGVCSEAEVVLQADQISTAFGQGNYLTFTSTFTCLAESGRLLAGRATLSAQRVDTLWAGAVGLDASLGWTSDGTNPIPTVAELSLTAGECSHPHGWAKDVNLQLHSAPFNGDHRHVLDLRRFQLAGLEPFELHGTVEVGHLETPWFAATNVSLAAAWSAPTLSVTNLSVTWAGGHLAAGADLDAASGRLTLTARSDFDPKRLYSLLPQEAVVWLNHFTWEEPPVVNGVLGITLPARPPRALLWPGDLRPSLFVDGRFEAGRGTFRRIPLSGASSHFTYSNMCWHLPDLIVRRPDGALWLEHRNNDRTHHFLWQVRGAVDPTPAMVVIPQAATEARAVLETLKFGGPPEVQLAIAGTWAAPESVQAWGTLRATNVAFRGCAFDEVTARAGLTNLVLSVSEPRVRAGEETASATLLQFDFPRRLAYVSNGVSRMAPMTVATVIGPQVVKAIQAYRFLKPPEARVEGVIPLMGVAGADMRFDLQGGPFHWQNFRLDEIQGRVLWQAETVSLTNVQAAFYGGNALGEAFFDFTGKRDADFWFNLRVDNADAQPLVSDVFQTSHRLEGRLTGVLSVTQGNTGDFGSWFGYGQASLKDGYLWSVPIFGIVSPLVDVFIPGLGRSRAREAEGRYVITNSVIRTEHLVIHTSNMRLLYAGTVSFQGAVDAVAEAEILRDTLVVGEIVSTVLMPLSKVMIVEITGTLGNPQARPLYLLPRLLLAPLNPVRLFKDVFLPTPPAYQDTPAEPAPPEDPSPPQSP